MSTYKELQGQIEKLQHEAENARKNELINAINDIQIKMKEIGIKEITHIILRKIIFIKLLP